MAMENDKGARVQPSPTPDVVSNLVGNFFPTRTCAPVRSWSATIRSNIMFGTRRISSVKENFWFL